ncbi:MAG: hypothetical protein WDN08_05880 [Rhizomicrobium sp.]
MTADNIALASVLFAAVSAFFSAIAAVASLVETRRVARASDSTIYLELFREYRSPEMDVALDSLAKFWSERQREHASAADAFLEYREHNPDGAATIRRQSRMLVTHFNSVARLMIAGLISRRTARILITFPGLDIYYDVAAPIVRLENPQPEFSAYIAILKRIRPKYSGDFYGN